VARERGAQPVSRPRAEWRERERRERERRRERRRSIARRAGALPAAAHSRETRLSLACAFSQAPPPATDAPAERKQTAGRNGAVVEWTAEEDRLLLAKAQVPRQPPRSATLLLSALTRRAARQALKAQGEWKKGDTTPPWSLLAQSFPHRTQQSVRSGQHAHASPPTHHRRVRAQVHCHYDVLTRDNGAGDVRVEDTWPTEQDAKLRALVGQYGTKWQLVAGQLSAPVRSAEACRRRYLRLMNPDQLKREADRVTAARARKKARPLA
jgi:hypothetical protein